MKIINISLFILLLVSLVPTTLLSQHHGGCCKTSNNENPSTGTKNIADDLQAIDKNKDGIIFYCTMCDDQFSNEPGKCPSCGMKMEEVTIQKYQKDHPGMMSPDNRIIEGEIDLTELDNNGDLKVFQDPMDWNVISDEPGECPLCGMELKEVSLSKAKENLIKNKYKVK